MQTHRLTNHAIIVLVLVAAAVGALLAWRTFATPDLALVDLPARTTTAGPQHAATNFNPALVYQSRIASVVTIQSVFGGDTIGGTGFLADEDGHILTSSHVVVDIAAGSSEPDAIYVEFASNDRLQATLLGTDPFSDIAVLKVDPAELSVLKPTPLGNSDKVVVGEPVAAIGAPFGLEESLSTGIVSGTRRVVGSQINRNSNIADAIQIDAEINKGNSGGPLFNARGQVIGINQQIRTTSGVSEGTAFAIPINTAKRALRQIVEDGQVEYAWLGLSTATVTPQLAREYGLRAPHGALVAEATGPAAAAGISGRGRSVLHMGEAIRLGDHVVQIAGAEVVTREDVNRIANRIDVGQSVEVVYFRGSERRTTTLVAARKAV